MAKNQLLDCIGHGLGFTDMDQQNPAIFCNQCNRTHLESSYAM